MPRNDRRKSEIADYCSAAATLTLSTFSIRVGQKANWLSASEKSDYDIKYLVTKQKVSGLSAHLSWTCGQ